MWANFEMTAEQCAGKVELPGDHGQREHQALLAQPAAGPGDDPGRGPRQRSERVPEYRPRPGLLRRPAGGGPGRPRQAADFLQFLVSHPPLQGKIDAVEPWNEQNLSWEWGGPRLWPNAPASPPQGVLDFVQLQKAAYQGVKAGDGRVTVVLPALTLPGSGSAGATRKCTQRFCLDAVRLAIDDVLYLEFLYGVNNGEIKHTTTSWASTPATTTTPGRLPRPQLYPLNPASGHYKGHGFYLKRYRQLRAVQERHEDTRPVWITEMGWSSAPRPEATSSGSTTPRSSADATWPGWRSSTPRPPS